MGPVAPAFGDSGASAPLTEPERAASLLGGGRYGRVRAGCAPGAGRTPASRRRLTTRGWPALPLPTGSKVVNWVAPCVAAARVVPPATATIAMPLAAAATTVARQTRPAKLFPPPASVPPDPSIVAPCWIQSTPCLPPRHRVPLRSARPRGRGGCLHLCRRSKLTEHSPARAKATRFVVPRIENE